MAEDWNAVAAEVEAALASIGDTSEPNGHPAVIRKVVPGVVDPEEPWAPVTDTITYHQVVVLISDTELRDINGTLIGMAKRTVTISGAAGVVPHDDDRIVLGMTSAQVTTAGDANVAWRDLVSVKPLAPAGIAVLYELTLQG
ncbi:MAG: hypothetical protein CML24_11475 [Rhizobiales bacterium]|nr:hypothetical protein [Hyphomicrobiales bacterium]|tara:strand:- start:3233 stop:3658 length:426 start_codon:yes stop_codon:yes gene_type:complete